MLYYYTNCIIVLTEILYIYIEMLSLVFHKWEVDGYLFCQRKVKKKYLTKFVFQISFVVMIVKLFTTQLVT